MHTEEGYWHVDWSYVQSCVLMIDDLSKFHKSALMCELAVSNMLSKRLEEGSQIVLAVSEGLQADGELDLAFQSGLGTCCRVFLAFPYALPCNGMNPPDHVPQPFPLHCM